MNEQMKGITCCGDCVHYDWKKHRCPRAKDRGNSQSRFYVDCPLADVRPVQPIIDRIDKDRLMAKGKWHADRYWLGWTDAMRRAKRIVDGTVDDEPVYAPSNGADMREESK